MKIGLIAAYNDNYGSLLQVYATQQVLIQNGHCSEIIVYKQRKLLTQLMRCFNLSLFKMKMDIIYRQIVTKSFYNEIYRNIQIRNNKFSCFRKENLIFSREFQNEDDLKNALINDYDLIMLGSDQVWNPINMGTHFFTMELVPDEVYKITYGPSFGVSEIPWYQKKNTQKYLNRINCISVREKTGAKIVKKYTGKDVKVVCDPTILINKQEWFLVSENKRLIEDNYLFCYFLGKNPNQRGLAREYARRHNLKIVALQHLDQFIKDDIKFADYSLFDVDPFDFVSIIRNASFIMTDSFHGTIFSLLFERNFYCLPRFPSKKTKSTNSRIDDLLKYVGLSNRKLTGYENVEQLNNPKETEIDFKMVSDNLRKIQEYSLDYLNTSIWGVNNDN